MSRILEQQRAEDALKKVKDLEQKNQYDKYASYVAGLPATIINNGLGQAAATLLAAAAGKKDEHRLLYDHLEDWLCRSDSKAPYPTPAGRQKDLMQSIVSGNRAQYMHAQAEALAWLQWLKKFAAAFLKK